MTEPSPTRPVPAPPRPVPTPPEVSPAPEAERGEERFAGLDGQPVTEHVAVFEAEHSRLQRELGTIDRL
jgi:hypothetical protein